MNIERILATKGEKVVTVHPDQSVKDAVRLLHEHRIGALVVVDTDGTLRGIVSERDVVREAAVNDCVLELDVAAIMTSDVITGNSRDDLMSVATTMTERRVRHMPVLDGGRVVGIVSIGDVLKAQRDQLMGEVDTLQTQLISSNA
jgi:CBS domain-containing protein